MIWLYTALNRAPKIDCYWVGAVPKVAPKSAAAVVWPAPGFRFHGLGFGD